VGGLAFRRSLLAAWTECRRDPYTTLALYYPPALPPALLALSFTLFSSTSLLDSTFSSTRAFEAPPDTISALKVPVTPHPSIRSLPSRVGGSPALLEPHLRPLPPLPPLPSSQWSSTVRTPPLPLPPSHRQPLCMQWLPLTTPTSPLPSLSPSFPPLSSPLLNSTASFATGDGLLNSSSGWCTFPAPPHLSRAGEGAGREFFASYVSLSLLSGRSRRTRGGGAERGAAAASPPEASFNG
jgi:hypothetical protein